MFKSISAGLAFLVFTSIISCKNNGSNSPARKLNFEAFGRYWYQGKAEINTYNLEQYRYGEKRQGEAVMIFVTEDLSREKQVKLDAPEQNQEDAQKVLKLNFTKKFVTGVYPYSMMLSTFTPVYDSIPAVKITASCQEWCGQTYTQLNYRNGSYKAALHSYFEKEGDLEIKINALAEDDLWNLIRLNAQHLPVGEHKVLPGLLDQRFTHESFEGRKATISVEPGATDQAGFSATQLQTCIVSYKDYPRVLRIHFTKAFPFEIVGWEEFRKTADGKEEVSRATRKVVRMLDYWNKNNNESEPLRQELQLHDYN